MKKLIIFHSFFILAFSLNLKVVGVEVGSAESVTQEKKVFQEGRGQFKSEKKFCKQAQHESVEVVNTGTDTASGFAFVEQSVPLDIFDVNVFGEWTPKWDLSDINAKKALAKKKLFKGGVIHHYFKELYVYLAYSVSDDELNQLCEAATSILKSDGQIVVLVLNVDLSSDGMKRLRAMEAKNKEEKRYGLKVYSNAQNFPKSLWYTNVKPKDLLRLATDYMIVPAKGILFSTTESAMGQQQLEEQEEIEIITDAFAENKTKDESEEVINDEKEIFQDDVKDIQGILEKIEEYRLSVEKGDANAQYKLEDELGEEINKIINDVFGKIKPKDDAKDVEDELEKIKEYRLSAEKGDANAQYELGRLYKYGRGGLAKDHIKAKKYYRFAAKQGHRDAQFELGIMYYYSEIEVPKNYIKAKKWLTLAAKSSSVAQFILGEMHEEGLGAPKDIDKALEWYHKAAEAGNIDAQYKVKTLKKVKEPSHEHSKK